MPRRLKNKKAIRRLETLEDTRLPPKEIIVCWRPPADQVGPDEEVYLDHEERIANGWWREYFVRPKLVQPKLLKPKPGGKNNE